jgi:hypothetical protein
MSGDLHIHTAAAFDSSLHGYLLCHADIQHRRDGPREPSSQLDRDMLHKRRPLFGPIFG